MTPRIRIHLLGAVLVAALVGSCGDPYVQPGCDPGAGCGSDDQPPVGTLVNSPAPNDTIRGPFWVEVTATDNIGIAGVDFWMNGVAQTPATVTVPPYRSRFDPVNVIPQIGTPPGSRFVTVFVRDAAHNVDTLHLTVFYVPCLAAPRPQGVPCV